MKPLPDRTIAAFAAILIATSLLLAGTAQAGKPEAGPNGGRLAGTPPDLAEVLIAPDGILTVTFLDADKKPAGPGSRSVTVVAQLDSGKKEIPIEAKGGSFATTEALPTPEGYTLVVQIRATPDAKPVNTRILYRTHICEGCSLGEYACICEGH